MKKWTRFMDMHSGGSTKIEPYEYIYIEANEDEAKVIFYNKFGRNPERVTCTCCGEDYSIDEAESLSDATAYERGADWCDVKKSYIPESGQPLSEYIRMGNALIVEDKDIEPHERQGEVPDEGYIWQ